MRIAILGATGYIGRSLVHACNERGITVIPFSRDPEKGKRLLALYGIATENPLRGYDSFETESFDVVINATGIGSPLKLKTEGKQIFTVTESVDALLLSYLEKYPKTRVFNLSSGAIYGKSASEVIAHGTQSIFDPANLSVGDCYALAKLVSEAKHRVHPEYTITDLRVFSFFSRFVDTTDTFLLSQIVSSLEKGDTFLTSADDIVRDFTTADEILNVIEFLLTKEATNTAYDLISKEPVTKFGLLEHFKTTRGLQYEISKDIPVSPTGKKSVYASSATTLKNLGYVSKETSLEALDREMSARKA